MQSRVIEERLSVRELPWLLQGAKERGFTTHEVNANASELPGETDEFARALGFASRSKLQNNGGGLAHKLQAATTECVDLPWKDCEALVGNTPNQIFWHHWPDAKLHDGSGAGQGPWARIARNASSPSDGALAPAIPAAAATAASRAIRGRKFRCMAEMSL